MLIAHADLPGIGVRNLRLSRGRITELAPTLTARRGEDVLDASGCCLLPGLHDHHIHLRAAAAALGSLDASQIEDAPGLRDALARFPRRADPAGIRVVGYHDSIAGPLDRDRLDELSPQVTSVRVQHRSGALWVLNSAALAAFGPAARSEPGVDEARGHLWRRDDLLRRLSSLDEEALAEVAQRCAARGVTGFTDATPGASVLDVAELARDLRHAGVRQRLVLMGPLDSVPPHDATLGPVKILLDDTTLPSLDELVAIIRETHDAARAVAVHCVTRVQLVLTTAALELAGAIPGDRIEHGSVIPPGLVGNIAAIGVTVVSQPHFIAERGDTYLREVAHGDLDSLYRLRTLRSAGIPLAAGSDAPFGDLDPWKAIAAAIERRTASGHRLGGSEALDPAAAIGLFLGSLSMPGTPRRLEAGAPADLCLLGVCWRDLPSVIADPPVRATLVGGEIVHSSD